MNRNPFSKALSLCVLAIVASVLSACTVTVITPTPAPPQIAPAQGNQSLILIADFDDRSGGKNAGLNPAEYIYEALKAQIKSDGLEQSIGLQRLHQALDENSAVQQGKVYSATLVVWGWYDALNTRSHIQQIRTRKWLMPEVEASRMSLVSPSEIETIIVAKQPEKVKYLTLLALGIDSTQFGEPDQALRYFTSAVNVASESGEVLDRLQAHYHRGTTYQYIAILNEGDKRSTFTDFDEAIKLEPNDALGYFYRGLAHDHLGKQDQALADYNQAVKLNPGDARYYRIRGQTYGDMGKHDQAIADFNKAISLKWNDDTSYYERGLVYEKMGKLDQALADFNQAITLDRDNGSYYSSRGYAYLKLGKYDQALADFDQVIKLEPESAGGYCTRGTANRMKGDNEQAVTDFKQCLAIARTSPYRRFATNELQSLGVQP
jgi:tetratricopeptide (TPR) repeat protein